MKIATWNIERLKHMDELSSIVENCEQTEADVLVLTETDSRVKLNYKYCISTAPPDDEVDYKPTETRVSIYTNYEPVTRHTTFNEHTAVCVEFKTDVGNLIVYGTVIGIYGNRHENFMSDLQLQVKDIECLAKRHNLCVIGDFNCSFADSYYFTKKGRAILEDVLERNEIELLTRNQPECIDHIAVSRSFAKNTLDIKEWNQDKKLSDHKGIVVELV